MEELLAIASPICTVSVMVSFVVVVLVWQKKNRAQMDQDTQEYRVGSIAERLGMRIERGEPMTNLLVNQAALESQRYDVVLRGERQGVPIELVYFKAVWVEAEFIRSTQYREWEARLTARTGAQFGHFEATLRQPQQWNRVRTYFSQPMPELSTGNGRTDSMLRVTGDNPAIAGALGGLLEPLTRLNYVHVIGRPGEVTFLVSHSDAGRGTEMIGVGYALHDCELIFDVLSRVVRTAEGRA